MCENYLFLFQAEQEFIHAIPPARRQSSPVVIDDSDSDTEQAKEKQTAAEESADQKAIEFDASNLKQSNTEMVSLGSGAASGSSPQKVAQRRASEPAISMTKPVIERRNSMSKMLENDTLSVNPDFPSPIFPDSFMEGDSSDDNKEPEEKMEVQENVESEKSEKGKESSLVENKTETKEVDKEGSEIKEGFGELEGLTTEINLNKAVEILSQMCEETEKINESEKQNGNSEVIVKENENRSDKGKDSKEGSKKSSRAPTPQEMRSKTPLTDENSQDSMASLPDLRPGSSCSRNSDGQMEDDSRKSPSETSQDTALPLLPEVRSETASKEPSRPASACSRVSTPDSTKHKSRPTTPAEKGPSQPGSRPNSRTGGNSEHTGGQRIDGTNISTGSTNTGGTVIGSTDTATEPIISQTRETTGDNNTAEGQGAGNVTVTLTNNTSVGTNSANVGTSHSVVNNTLIIGTSPNDLSGENSQNGSVGPNAQNPRIPFTTLVNQNTNDNNNSGKKLVNLVSAIPGVKAEQLINTPRIPVVTLRMPDGGIRLVAANMLQPKLASQVAVKTLTVNGNGNGPQMVTPVVSQQISPVAPGLRVVTSSAVPVPQAVSLGVTKQVSPPLVAGLKLPSPVQNPPVPILPGMPITVIPQATTPSGAVCFIPVSGVRATTVNGKTDFTPVTETMPIKIRANDPHPFSKPNAGTSLLKNAIQTQTNGQNALPTNLPKLIPKPQILAPRTVNSVNYSLDQGRIRVQGSAPLPSVPRCLGTPVSVAINGNTPGPVSIPVNGNTILVRPGIPSPLRQLTTPRIVPPPTPQIPEPVHIRTINPDSSTFSGRTVTVEINDPPMQGAASASKGNDVTGNADISLAGDDDVTVTAVTMTPWPRANPSLINVLSEEDEEDDDEDCQVRKD